MEHVLYWLWLTTKKRMNSEKITRLLERFETVEDIYSSRSFYDIYGLSPKDASALMDKDMSVAKRVAEETLRLGARILTFDDELYPEILKNIFDPPYVLYIQGELPRFDEVLTIGAVGTRKPSEYGEIMTKRLCAGLAEAGAVTVGGLASGIDTVGAWAALDAGGTAVGVIGSGLDIIYPRENAELVREITEKGCIITEYPPQTPPAGYNFPARNRIIAGLSRGLLVTEAPKGSGALITARCALENNRDVFAVPRNINETAYLGTNLLIQQGAKLINSVEDILCEYPYAARISPRARKTDEKRQEKKSAPKIITGGGNKYDDLSGTDRDIVELLKKSDMQIDEISRGLNIPVSDVNTRLILLEVKGIVKKLPGSAYQLKI